MSNPKVYAPEFTPRWGSREGEAEADVRVWVKTNIAKITSGTFDTFVMFRN